MEQFNMLLVEDGKMDIELIEDTVGRMNDSQDSVMYSLDVAKTVEEAYSKVKTNEYHGCIVDIKLGGDENGNDFVKALVEGFRVPVVVYSATPDCEAPVKCYTKSQVEPSVVIKELEEENATGIFRVLGGRGIIEKRITEVFWNVLYPNMDTWKEYQKMDKNTEEILLRYTVAYLIELLDEEKTAYCTEEMYIIGPIEEPIKTGCIYENKQSKVNYVLLSPPCDIVKQKDGKRKSDSLLLCEIEPIAWENIDRSDIVNVIKNNKGDYYHWLPDNKLYRGGRLNFRKVLSCPINVFSEEYEFKGVKIQERFVKNVLQRFSAYYSRQGQPDFDFKEEAKNRTIE